MTKKAIFKRLLHFLLQKKVKIGLFQSIETGIYTTIPKALGVINRYESKFCLECFAKIKAARRASPPLTPPFHLELCQKIMIFLKILMILVAYVSISNWNLYKKLNFFFEAGQA